MRWVSSTVLLAGAMLLSSGAWACPECAEGIRKQVRAGIFNETFAQNLAMAALPFGVLAGITAVLHAGLPRRRQRNG